MVKIGIPMATMYSVVGVSLGTAFSITSIFGVSINQGICSSLMATAGYITLSSLTTGAFRFRPKHFCILSIAYSLHRRRSVSVLCLLLFILIAWNQSAQRISSFTLFILQANYLFPTPVLIFIFLQRNLALRTHVLALFSNLT